MQLIVLGMHRSGTSSVTRLLNLAGAYFGTEDDATDPNEENPKGFWERRDIRAVCDGLLHGGGFDWWRVADFAVDRIPKEVREQRVEEFREIVRQLDAHRPWVIKEPRLCLLLPALRPVLESPVAVHVVREPMEIAESLAARNGFPVPVGLALWELYTVHAIAASSSCPSVTVSYADVMRDPVGTTAAVVDELTALGVEGLKVPTKREILAFVDPELYRQRRERSDRDAYMNASQAELALAADELRLTRSTKVPQLSAGATAILRAFDQQEATVAELEADRREIQVAHRQLSNEHRKLEDMYRLLEAAGDRVEFSLAAQVRAARLKVDVHRASEMRLEADIAQRRRAEQRADDSLAIAAQRMRSVRGSGAVKVGATLSRVRDRVRGQETRGVDVAVEGALRQIRRARSELTGIDQGDLPKIADLSDIPPVTDEVRELRRASRLGGGRPKVAVLAWDVGHNPFGRAHLLADLLRDQFDVELWGAQFERYGSNLWQPLRDTDIAVRRYPGAEFPEFFGTMQEAARRIDADAIYVSKPRFPGLGVGVLAKESWNRPLILDIDDFEPAFFQADTGRPPEALRAFAGDADFALPFGRLWTQACESIVNDADQLTVSNSELQQRYGGVIVPHARDEVAFDPRRFDRTSARAMLGLRRNDKLILFGGTPRTHKGILDLLKAVDRLGDPHIRVGAFVTRELEELRHEIDSFEQWIVPVPYHYFDELPSVLAAADLAVALQSPDHPVSRYQMPAKVTDAMAMAVPCLVTPVPPLQPLIDKDVLEVFDGDAPLDERLREILDNEDEARERAERARQLFLDTYSYAAVRPIVSEAIERHLDDPGPVGERFSSAISVARDVFAPSPEATSNPPAARRRRMPEGRVYDLVVFWKQNDTGIYGRRQDMFLKYLERSGRFGKIVHFDHPMSVEGLLRTAQRGIGSADQNRLVVEQTLRRVAHRADHGAVRSRTFLYSVGQASKKMKVPRRSEYGRWVRSVLVREGIGSARPVIFWVYPTSTFFPALADALAPDLVVADVVDDNRTWYEPGTPNYEQLQENYGQILARSDVVLANCEPVAASMSEFAPQVHVVPNACELPGVGGRGERPSELRGLTGPVIGYAGNLSGRVDLELLRQLAQARRDWNFVFLGSTHLDRAALDLAAEPNVRLLGTKRYDKAQSIIAHFDVALIPHVDNEMSRSMNPLKAYVYCSLGVPIVSSPVANLEQLAPYITVANGWEEYVDAIEGALRQGRSLPDRAELLPHSWDARVERVLELIDEAVEQRRAEPG